MLLTYDKHILYAVLQITSVVLFLIRIVFTSFLTLSVCSLRYSFMRRIDIDLQLSLHTDLISSKAASSKSSPLTVILFFLTKYLPSGTCLVILQDVTNKVKIARIYVALNFVTRCFSLNKNNNLLTWKKFPKTRLNFFALCG